MQSRPVCRIIRGWAALLTFVSCAWAWGNEGHQLIARIAVYRLNTTTKIKISAILGVGASDLPDAMAAAAVWPDQIRSTARQTTSWHFIDIPLSDSHPEIAKYCPNKDCSVLRLEDFIKRLKTGLTGSHGAVPVQSGPLHDPNLSGTNLGAGDNWTPAQQVAFILHLTGDIHQPLHSSTNGDKGGNCVHVDTSDYGTGRNLHAVWDTDVVTFVERKETAAKAAEQLLALSKISSIALNSEGNAETWALESHTLALSIYDRLPLKIEPVGPLNAPCPNLPVIKLPSSYLTQQSALAASQLTKAGLRLAALLNQIFDEGTPQMQMRK